MIPLTCCLILKFMNFWFAAFLFGGFLIAVDDLYWPFKLFYYVMPMGYYLRSSMYNFLHNTDFSSCDPSTNISSPVCVDPPTGPNVLTGIGLVYPVISNEDQVVKDIGILLAIAMFFKVWYFVGVAMKANRYAKIHSK
jgi:hypothetical protein